MPVVMPVVIPVVAPVVIPVVMPTVGAGAGASAGDAVSCVAVSEPEQAARAKIAATKAMRFMGILLVCMEIITNVACLARVRTALKRRES